MIAIELGEVIMAATTFDAAHRLQEPLPARPDSFERATSTGLSHPRQAVRKDVTSMIEQKTDFQPLDPDVVSASIPAFFIGRNKAGFWVAREARGRVGGIFLFKSSAVEFAREESAPLRCALIFPT